MIILDEKNYAEDCLQHGVPDKNPVPALSIIARYFYHCKGLRGKRIVTELEKCLERSNIDYAHRKARWDELLEKLARTAGQRPIHEIDGVWITANELATIESLHDKVLERLAFTVLCIAKLNNRRNPNNDNWVNTNSKEVFKTARISDSEKKRYRRINMLYEKGLLGIPNCPSTSYRVEFVDNDSEDRLFINDFRELGYEYMLYKGVNLIRCGECGILTYGNINGTKVYCSQCKAYHPQLKKIVTCIDCGEEFIVDSMNNRSKRCPSCRVMHEKERWRLSKQKHRNKANVPLTISG